MNTLIIVKGQLRTWSYNKLNIRKFINDVVVNTKKLDSKENFFETQKVDLLISCWDLSYQLYPDHSSISYLTKEKTDFTADIEYFKSLKIINNVYINQINYLETHEYFKNINFELEEEYHLQCYLTYKTGLKKRIIELENNLKYDVILEIRPDVYYDFMVANKQVKVPGFGEILTLHGNYIIDFMGMSSPVARDLIFYMNSDTYNIFSNEIIFHYNNFIKNKFYTTAHIEKNKFFEKNNFQVNDLMNAFCSEATIVRPNLNYELLENVKSEIEIIQHLRFKDNEWMLFKNQFTAEKIKLGVDFLKEEAQSIKINNEKKIKKIYS